MINDMVGAAQRLVEQGAEYIDIRVVETQLDGYSRDTRLIVENKAQEGENEASRKAHKDRHPSSPDS